MTLFTTKKVTVIYQLISSLTFLLLSFQSFASEDLASYCFASGTNLSEAKNSMEFLLLPREKVFMRSKDNCFDIVTSGDRAKLLEKFLRKRYNLVEETSTTIPNDEKIQDEHCRLEFKVTREKKIETKNLQLGTTNSVSAGEAKVQEGSTSELLLGLGKPGWLDMEGNGLMVECRKGATGVYQLIFAFSEAFRSRVSSEVSLKQGEFIDVGQVTRDLNEKSKILGLPETQFRQVEGQEKTKYELRIK